MRGKRTDQGAEQHVDRYKSVGPYCSYQCILVFFDFVGCLLSTSLNVAIIRWMVAMLLCSVNVDPLLCVLWPVALAAAPTVISRRG